MKTWFKAIMTLTIIIMMSASSLNTQKSQSDDIASEIIIDEQDGKFLETTIML